ncbi:RING-H2 finger protein ATL79-like [Curcuma longa]|uniref:RING-H2 finger protein ATL79-like n=1 Tax=Curcuma longa TaxID=136217 RepID=UPI003D9E0A38
MPPPHAAAAADELLIHPMPSPPTPAGSWGPYSGAGEFGSTMAIILAALFSTVLLAYLLAAAVRLLLARRFPSEEQVDPEKSAAAAVVQVPTTLFSAAGTRLAGAVAECAICLTEFAEGDAVRVLPACNHGFHGRCVEQWLATRGSCPSCRAACS